MQRWELLASHKLPPDWRDPLYLFPHSLTVCCNRTFLFASVQVLRHLLFVIWTIILFRARLRAILQPLCEQQRTTDLDTEVNLGLCGEGERKSSCERFGETKASHSHPRSSCAEVISDISMAKDNLPFTSVQYKRGT